MTSSLPKCDKVMLPDPDSNPDRHAPCAGHSTVLYTFISPPDTVSDRYQLSQVTISVLQTNIELTDDNRVFQAISGSEPHI